MTPKPENNPNANAGKGAEHQRTLTAVMHRVVNGGGSLECEYEIGSARMDLCLHYGAVTLAMELKVWRKHKQDPLAQGLQQLDKYLAGLGLQEVG